MEIIKNYIYHYYHLSLATCLITALSFKATGNIIDWQYCIWVGLGTFLLYNYHYVLDLTKTDLIAFAKRNISFLGVVIVYCITGLFLLPNLQLTIPALIIAGILSLMYFRSIRILPLAGREYFWLKHIIIGLVFGILTAYVPYISSGYTFGESSFLMLGRVFFIGSLALVFDIGDISFDEKTNYTTLPQVIGIKNTKWVACLCLFVAALIEGWGAWTFLIDFPIFMALFLTCAVTCIIIWVTKKEYPKWFYLLVVDGLIMLPFVLSFL